MGLARAEVVRMSFGQAAADGKSDMHEFYQFDYSIAHVTTFWGLVNNLDYQSNDLS